MTLPFLALRYLFKPKLLALGFFPGAFTFLASAVLVYLAWSFAFASNSLWITIPVMALLFLVAWLFVGGLSLLLVEDKIIDECQKIYLGEVRYSSPRFSWQRLFRELRYSLFIVLLASILVILSFLPLLGSISFLLTGGLTAYSFLSTVFARKESFVSGRLSLFFRDFFSNLLLGVFLNFLLFVPILNVFLLGYAQILATLVFLRREEL